MYTRVVLDKGDISPTFAMDDRIFLGEGLFETLKVIGSRPCFTKLHWQRLQHSANQLGISFDLSLDDWEEHLITQIRCDNLYHGGIKAILSGGKAPRGLAQQGHVSQLMFQTFNYALHTEPARLATVAWLRDATNPIYGLKSINYLEAIIARRHAIAAGFDDALFFNTKHYATETTCANLFLIQSDTLITPPLKDGILPGITRARVLALATECDIIWKEQSINKACIRDADAAFITNSLQGIRAVCSIDAITLDSNHPLIERLTSDLPLE